VIRDMMSSSSRNRSMDRDTPPLPTRDQGNREFAPSKEHHHNKLQSMAGHRAEGAGFFGGLRNSRAADMISKGLFGKSMRSGSTTEREPIIDDEHYSLKVINLPLVEQTRLTRISKRLEDSRDKTEFWMPAFPWRAIDYLNYKGCDVEGLYRVPGSGPQIKKWQRRFDEGESGRVNHTPLVWVLTDRRVRREPVRTERPVRHQHRWLHAQGVAS
jgi:hypothetical protein